MKTCSKIPNAATVNPSELVRLALLRLFISWWMIPAVWIIVLPIAWLLFGNIAFRDCCHLSKIYWTGKY